MAKGGIIRWSLNQYRASQPAMLNSVTYTNNTNLPGDNLLDKVKNAISMTWYNQRGYIEEIRHRARLGALFLSAILAHGGLQLLPTS